MATARTAGVTPSTNATRSVVFATSAIVTTSAGAASTVVVTTSAVVTPSVVATSAGATPSVVATSTGATPSVVATSAGATSSVVASSTGATPLVVETSAGATPSVVATSAGATPSVVAISTGATPSVVATSTSAALSVVATSAPAALSVIATTSPGTSSVVAVTGQVVGNLNDPEYLNWYKANRALHCTIDVLRHVCFSEMQSFHISLLHKHGHGTCSVPCSCSDIKHHGRWRSWSIPCPSKVCSRWLSDIVRAKSKKSTTLNWNNSEFSLWQTEPWQIAKIYMNHGQDKACVNPVDTDASGILQLLLNFKPLTKVLTAKSVHAVRVIRNLLMHSNRMKVSQTDLGKYIQTMVHLLQDPATLLLRPAAKQAVVEIKQIETTPVEVNDTAFLVQERNVWKQHISSQADENKRDILKLVRSNSNLESRLQGVVNDFGTFKDQVKEEMEVLRTRLEAQLERKIELSKEEVQDELEKWRVRLKESQRRLLEHYVRKKNEDENTTFEQLDDIYVDLRMHNNDIYNVLENRIHHDELQLQMNFDSNSQTTVQDLFVAERPDMTSPVRSLVIGKPGIGKSTLCFHLVNKWLTGDLLPNDIHLLFLIQLRDLADKKTCSLEDVFFTYQRCEKPSQAAISEFFRQLFSDTGHQTLLILDGWDEIDREKMAIEEVFEYYEQVEMPKLVASIINRWTIPSTRVLVTSRPGCAAQCDKKAELHGFSYDKMLEYIGKFSGSDLELKKSIQDYISQNVNIGSLCYIPVQLNMVCHIVKERLQNNDKLPDTLTELYVCSVETFLIRRHPKFNDSMKDIITQFKDSVLSHAKLALFGMEHNPVQITFSEKDIHQYHLESVTTQCGLVTESRELRFDMCRHTARQVYYFVHLTVQEFLAAITLATDVKRLQRMMKKSTGRQLDLVVIFLSGLLGNSRNHPFLGSLYTSQCDSFQRRSAKFLMKLINLVVSREKANEALLGDEDKMVAHKIGVLLLLTIIYESQQPRLWRHVSKYVLKGGTELNITEQHINPTELEALVYVLPETGVTLLKLDMCGVSGKAAEHLLTSLGSLQKLEQISLYGNELNGPAIMAALSSSLLTLTHLVSLSLGGCQLTDNDVVQLAEVLPALKRLEILLLHRNAITDVGALRVTEVAVTLPKLVEIWLYFNWLTKDGADTLMDMTSTCSIWLIGLTAQRVPGQDETHPDPVVHWQRRVDQLEAALGQLRAQPVRWRDMNWDFEQKQLQRWLDWTLGYLHLAQSKSPSDDSSQR